jgi:hypothetical protein
VEYMTFYEAGSTVTVSRVLDNGKIDLVRMKEATCEAGAHNQKENICFLPKSELGS